MQLQYLTQCNVDSVVIACQSRENLDHTTPDGLLERRADVTYEQIRDADLAVKNVLDGMSDDVLAELQALFWIGRSDSGAKDWETELWSSRNDLNNTTRSYLAGKGWLGRYVLEGIKKTCATLAC
jgi:hypothetical protein